jgi:uncharacterized protein YhaN
MSIHIENINVKNLGPISELTWNLKNINLIYGENERGKSYLVEFLIRCLFKTSGWKLRDEKGIGKIEVEGLSDEKIDFTPESSEKLEDFLTGRYIGLPPDFSKLLVLRGTNVELGKEDESDKIMLRRYLSHKEILNAIVEDIQVTVKDCDISGYTITGADRGNLRLRNELESKIKRIENLFIEVGNKFLSGEMKTLENKKIRLKEKYNNLEKAKRWKAFQLSEEIEKLKEKTEKIDEEKIDELISNFNKLKGDKRDLNNYKTELDELKESTKHYKWLDKVIEEYIQYNFDKISPRPRKWILFLLSFFVISTAILIAFGFKWFGFGMLFISIGIGTYYIRKILFYVKGTKKREELQNLKDDFRDRFGEELKNLAVMNEKKEIIGKAYNKKEILEERLVEKKKDLSIFESRLREEISDILREKYEKDKWKEKLIEEKDKKRELEGKISDKRSELSGLQVDKEDYLRSKPEVKFDNDEYKEVKEKLGKIEDEIQQKKSELENLKHSIIEHTEDEISIGWMELIENLANKREDVLKEYKDITSEIIADKNVYDVISELYEEEDEKIEDFMKSDVISKILKDVTTRYNKISLLNDRMIVSDSFNDFPVTLISDGATEQVFLALRIGMAKHWFKEDELFLILDDAFLHSDYNRRPKLVDKIVELAKNGWQIICFTFDDNIRNLIDKKVKNLKNEYRFLNLNEI